MVDKDIIDELLGDEAGKDKVKEEPPKKHKKEQSTGGLGAGIITKEKDKREEIAYQTPQDRFRAIITNQGYKVGVENLLTLFFDGDTNSPKWLDEVLILGNIPAKNREIIITTYFGKTLTELGVTIMPVDRTKSGLTTVDNKTVGADGKKVEVDEFTNFSEDMIKEQMKATKMRYAMAQMAKMTEELERSRNPPQPAVAQTQQQAPSMRQITRPIIKDGQPLKDSSGNVVYETVYEPVAQGQGTNNYDLLSMISAIKALDSNTKPHSDSEITNAIKAMTDKISSIEKNSEIQRQEDRIKRLEEEQKRKEDEYKRDLLRIEENNKKEREEANKERIRDLDLLKEKFSAQLEHRKELENIIGSVTNEHKKEMDEIKKRLEHAQTNIERTVVAKGTDTVDKLTGKMADMADSVVKPMVGVMKDHYQLTIDTQRKQLGLQPLRESIPEVAEEELARFAKGQ